MKTRLELISEIIFHTKKCEELEKAGAQSTALYYASAGRIIALRWVIDEPTCLIEELELEYELTKDEN